MSEYEYLSITPEEFWYKCEGYRQKELKEWHRARWISYLIYGAAAGKDAKSIHEFLPLEDDEVDEPLSKDEIKQMRETFLKAMNG